MSFSVRNGAMVYWSLGQETDPDKLRDGLAGLGLPDYAPQPRTWLMSLKAALCRRFSRTEEMVRPLKGKEKHGYSVVLERRGNERNEYAHQLRASIGLDDSGLYGDVELELDWSVSIDRYELRSELQALSEHFRRVLPATSVSKTLVQLVKEDLKGVTMRDAGGVYFVHEDHVQRFRDVARVIEDAAVGDSTNRVTAVDFTLDQATMRDIADGLVHEMEYESSRLVKDITENDRGDQALLNRAVRAAALRERVREYEQLLQRPLDACHKALDVAVQAFAAPTAIKESKEVFDSVF